MMDFPKTSDGWTGFACKLCKGSGYICEQGGEAMTCHKCAGTGESYFDSTCPHCGMSKIGHAGATEACASLRVAATRIAELKRKLAVVKLLRIDEWERLARYVHAGSDWGWSVSVTIAAICDMLKDDAKE